MTLPSDVAGIRHTWIRQTSHAWTERALRDMLVNFLDAFQDTHLWVSQMKLEESFTDTGVHVRVPYGPTGPLQRQDNFLQRDGIPTIIITATRESDGREFEVGLPFALANDTTDQTTLFMLEKAGEAIEVSERLSHGN